MPNFAGSIPRNLNEKLGEHPSVLDFGAIADARRIKDGAITTGTAIVTTVQRAVAGATNTTPIVITTSGAHGYSTGQFIKHVGVLGNTAANGTWPITVLGSTSYRIEGTTGNGAYSGGGTAQSAMFKPEDKGSPITVYGAGVAGADLSTSILSVNDSTSVTLATNASTTVSPAKIEWGTNNTPAFQAAVDGCQFFGKRLYIPSGRYLLSGPVSLPTEFHLYGAGRTSTQIIVDRAFPLTASGVFIGPGMLAGQSSEPGPICEDFFVSFHQPDTSNLANFIQWPRAFDMRGTPGVQFRNLVVVKGWIGIDLTPPGAVQITAATNASPVVYTTREPHGLVNGDAVTVNEVKGNDGANTGLSSRVATVVNSTQFSLGGSVGTASYTSGGWAIKSTAITTGGHVATLHNVSLGCYYENVILDQCYATVKMQGLYIWAYSFPDDLRGPLSAAQLSAFYDPRVIGIEAMRVDGMHVSDALINCGTPLFAHRGWNTTAGYGNFVGCHFDTTGNVTIEAGSWKFAGCFFTVAGPGFWGDASPEPTPNTRSALIVRGGEATFASTVFFLRTCQQTAIDINFTEPTEPVSVTQQHHATFVGCHFIQDIYDASAFTITGRVIATRQVAPYTTAGAVGHVTISGCAFERKADFTLTQPAIKVSNTDAVNPTYVPILVCDGNRTVGASPAIGNFLQIDQDNWHVVRNNSVRGLGFAFPSTQDFGYYQAEGTYGTEGLAVREVWANTYPGADMGAKINAAAADLPTFGGVIKVPAGVWEHTTKISLKRYVMLVGHGADPVSLKLIDTRATAALTLSGLPLNNETVTIDGRTYTWKTTLTGAADEILIPATVLESLRNIYITLYAFSSYSGSVFGTGTAVHATFRPRDPSATAIVVEHITPGTTGNGKVMSETMSNGSWSGNSAGGAATTGPQITFADGDGSGLIRKGGLTNITLLASGTGSGTIGLYLGGDPGGVYSTSTHYANHLLFDTVVIKDHQTGIQYGNNCNSNIFLNCAITGNGTDRNIPGGLSNSNTAMSFLHVYLGSAYINEFSSGAFQYLYAGSGSPETVVSAPQGAIYLRTDTGTPVPGKTLYYKEVGTGNTGWITRHRFTSDLVGLSTSELQGGSHLGSNRLQMKQNGSDTGTDGSIEYSTGGMWEITGGAGSLKGVRIRDRLAIGDDVSSLPADSAYIKVWVGINTKTRTGTGVLDVNGKSYFAGDVELVGARLGVLTAPDATYAIKTTSLWNTGGTKLGALTASRVPYIDASNDLVVSAVTPTELGYLAGVSSAIQTQLNAKAAASGYSASQNMVTDAGGAISTVAPASAISDVSGTAGVLYTSTEQTLINDLKAAVNAILAAIRSHKIVS